MLGCCQISVSKKGNKEKRCNRSIFRPNPKNNMHIEFLTIVKKNNLYFTQWKCFERNKKELLLKHSKELNGKLHIFIEDDEVDTQDMPYALQGIMLYDTLYARLPKEAVYIPVDTWQSEYNKSQIMEFFYIMRKLGAISINVALDIKNEKALEVSSSLLTPGINTDVGFKHSSLENKNNTIEFQATYDSDNHTMYTSLAEFIEDPMIYYLEHKSDWQDLVFQRIMLQVTNVKFSIVFSNVLNITERFSSKVSQFGIEAKYQNDKSKVMSLKGEVFFLSLKNLKNQESKVV